MVSFFKSITCNYISHGFENNFFNSKNIGILFCLEISFLPHYESKMIIKFA